MNYARLCLFVVIVVLVLNLVMFAQSMEKEKTYLVLRCDDIGMNHSVNLAAKQLFESELPVSVSVMFTCPWYQEAVEILKEYPNVSVGIHTTLNAEWQYYRWGPVLGKEAVPSLVDSFGFFFPSRARLFANQPKNSEIELELRAQIERAFNCGIKIDYIDHHMSAAVQTLELREMFEALAREFNLGIPTYFGETYSSITYGVDIKLKTKSLLAHLDTLKAGLNLQVLHIGLDTPEMQALKDLNPFGLKNMSAHRQAELNTILSPRFSETIKKNKINLITYRDLIRLKGLQNMIRPEIE